MTSSETTALYRAAVDQLGRGGEEPNSAAWLLEHRREAAARFRALGFPRPKDEPYRFTSLRDVLAVPFVPEREVSCASGRAATNGDAVSLRLVNGRPTVEGVLPEGVRIRTLREMTASELAAIEPHLFRIAEEDDGFVAHNSAGFEEAVVVLAERGRAVRGGMQIRYEAVSGSGPTLAQPRVLVVCEEGSELTLVETHDSFGDTPHLENSVTEIALSAGARLEHVRIHRGRGSAFAVARISVNQASSSRYASKVFTFGGGLARMDIRTRFEGPGSECELDGLYLARSGDRLDHHTSIDHGAPHATSRQRYKGILDGSGHAVFDGTVIVRRGAVRTRAHQENRNLLLGNDAIIHAKPHLEIDADDVQCSHGATVGRLDENQLFYLRSRGLPLSAARAALTYSFAREIIEAVPDERLRDVLSDLVLSSLPDGALAREVA